MIKYILVFIISICISSTSQILLKKSANIERKSKIKEYLNENIMNPVTKNVYHNINKKIDYNDTFNVKIHDDAELTSDTDIIVRSLKQPSCTNVNINEDGSIEFEIEKELGVEVVGETKMKIAIEDEEEPWQDLNEVNEDKVMQEIDENVKEEYLES